MAANYTAATVSAVVIHKLFVCVSCNVYTYQRMRVKFLLFLLLIHTHFCHVSCNEFIREWQLVILLLLFLPLSYTNRSSLCRVICISENASIVPAVDPHKRSSFVVQ